VPVTDRFYILEEIQDEPALFLGQVSTKRVTSQYMEHLYVKEVRDVHLFGLPEPTPYAGGALPEVKKHRHRRRSVNDDHKTLLYVARVVGVPHPADRDLRRLVYFDWLELRYLFEPLLHGWFSGYLLYLGEQVVGEGHAEARSPYLQRPVQLVGDVADLDHLRHAANINACG